MEDIEKPFLGDSRGEPGSEEIWDGTCWVPLQEAMGRTYVIGEDNEKTAGPWRIVSFGQ